MKCLLCGKPLKDTDKVLRVGTVVGNEQRGDFMSSTDEYVHLKHLINMWKEATFR
jgi:hypothetical protein